MQIADYQKLPIMEKITILNYLKQFTEDYPEGWFDMTKSDCNRLLNYFDSEIISELDGIKKDLQQLDQEQRHRDEMWCWNNLFNKLKKKYPGRYRVYFSTVYTIFKESEDGCSMEELYNALVKEDGSCLDWDTYQKLSEVYMYDDYKKKDGKIWYDTRQMTIGRGPYDAWKLAFADTTEWKLSIALQGYYH